MQIIWLYAIPIRTPDRMPTIRLCNANPNANYMAIHHANPNADYMAICHAYTNATPNAMRMQRQMLCYANASANAMQMLHQMPSQMPTRMLC